MIRFPCPGCEKKLAIRDELAGRNVLCPNCKTKVRVPGPERTEKDESDQEPVEAVRRAPPVKTGKVRPLGDVEDAARAKSRPGREEEVVDELDEVEEPKEAEEPAEDARAKRRIDEEDDEQPRRRPGGKRNKKIRPKQPNWLTTQSPVTLSLGGVIALGLMLTLAGFFVPPVLGLVLLAAMLAYLTAHFFVVYAAFQEGFAHGLLCLLFGPYTLIFAIMHFDQVRIAWLIWGTSLILLVFCGCGSVVGQAVFGNRAASPPLRHMQTPSPAAYPNVVG